MPDRFDLRGKVAVVTGGAGAQSARGVRFARLFTVDLGGRAFAHSSDRRYYSAGQV
jgi:hypothetical protein